MPNATTKRYPAADQYRGTVNTAATKYGVPAALLMAVIAQESEFNPRAYRAEPQIGDGSRGLMQLLYKTAKLFRADLRPDDLYIPAVNVDIGARYLADLLRAAARGGYGMDAAISSYNAGGSSVRPGDGKRPTVGKVPPATAMQSPFNNQKSYVNPVLEKLKYFQALGYSTAAPAYTSAGGKMPGGFPVALAVIAAGAILALRRLGA